MPRVLNGRLSPGQLQALRLAANGMTAGQIARRLGTTETGIHLRLNQAARSLGAASRPHLVALALVRGVLTAGDITDTPKETAA
jgi:DNA-binding NarL/FixJ family response regulator